MRCHFLRSRSGGWLGSRPRDLVAWSGSRAFLLEGSVRLQLSVALHPLYYAYIHHGGVSECNLQ